MDGKLTLYVGVKVQDHNDRKIYTYLPNQICKILDLLLDFQNFTTKLIFEGTYVGYSI